ncbi:hypothetical protein BB559_001920 [Furculomyces boomerangus]|uniref:RRM domain-containing protein n=2 Tax=Harpellales TaxID=61421 RepID=A0A2T9YZJ0_9FUNG|nr:hypothetical protein BB559_001920 [Furculomyces boomerangus]PWA02284.1 hypothetical protein BB558_001582 [Smittium angustum]
MDHLQTPNNNQIYPNVNSPNQQQNIQSPGFMFQDDSSSRTLYVGNLDARTSERMLFDIFSTTAQVVSVKIIPDKSLQQTSVCYGFVEFPDHSSAEVALAQMNGRKIFDHEIKVNWAFTGASQVREDTSEHSHVFVGDLSPEVNDQILSKAFSIFPTMSVARVMWDVSSGKSRGYGFVAFRDHADAEQAIATMNGEWLGSRAIRVNWANQKVSLGAKSTQSGSGTSMLNYETVVTQAAPHNSTVYCGNLTPYTTQEQLLPLFGAYGYVLDIKMQTDRGYAFVKMDSHESATMSIVSLTGFMLNGRPIKCSWGKDQYSHKLTGYQQANNPAYAYPYSYGVPQQHFAGHPNSVPPANPAGAMGGVVQPGAAAGWNNPVAGTPYSYDPYTYYNYVYSQNPEMMQNQMMQAVDPNIIPAAPPVQHSQPNPSQPPQ